MPFLLQIGIKCPFAINVKNEPDKVIGEARQNTNLPDFDIEKHSAILT